MRVVVIGPVSSEGAARAEPGNPKNDASFTFLGGTYHASVGLSAGIRLSSRRKTCRKPAGAEMPYHSLQISRIVQETPDARSFVLTVPADLSDRFTYQAGQFLT